MARTRFRFVDLRLIAVGLVFVLAWAGIGYRLFRVQGADAAELAQLGFDQRVRHETIQAKRGTIYDRDGIELAVTVYGKALVADPSLVEAPGEAAAILAPIVGVDYVELIQRLEGDGRFAYVARRLESDTVERAREAIESADLIGFWFVEEPLRIYPSGPDRFFYRSVEAELVFQRDEAGAVTGVEIEQGGKTTPGKRK